MGALAPAVSGRRVYLDANVFIYFLSGSVTWAPTVELLLTAARDGQVNAVTGDAVVSEIMVGPYRDRDPLVVRSVREFFGEPGFLEIVSHSPKAWDDAAVLRGTLGMPMIDALHVATAAEARCDALISNDQRMKAALGVEVIGLGAVATT